MALTNACFISYRHVTDERVMADLEQELSSEIQMWLTLPKAVYRDKSRLAGGQFFNNVLARALCESVCMVVVYIPPYFAPENPYCVREFRAMEEIEKKRLQLLGAKDLDQNGFIIPIICRGWDDFPNAIIGMMNPFWSRSFAPRSWSRFFSISSMAR